MTEGVKVDVAPLAGGVPGTDVAPATMNPDEAAARTQGWMSKDEWVAAGNDPELHRPAREFRERGDFFKRISDQNRKIESLSTALNALQTHHKVVYDKAYTRALADLKGQHRDAVEAGDVNKADQILDKMEVTKQEAYQTGAVLQQAQAPVVSADYEEFVSNNDWYANNKIMKRYADAEGNDFVIAEYRRTGRYPSPKQVVEAVEKAVKGEFPDKFGAKKTAPSQSAVAGTASPARPAPSVPGKSERDLPPEAKHVMDALIRQKVMTKEKYLQEYFSK